MNRWGRWAVCVSMATGWSIASGQVGDSYKVQSPELTAPARGSLAGSLSHTAFGPGDVARGTVSLPPPYTAPEERGSLLANVFPTYSPDAGISEWGMGWASDLALRRWRASGDLDYATDDLTGPFGRCVKGADGYWYPVGLGKLVRIEQAGVGFVAYASDGSKWRFGQTSRVRTPSGTYAWHLDEVETATGRKAVLAYEANSSGRLFLKQVDYGGIGTSFEHRVTVDYATLARKFTDYRSGVALTLDRRVSGIKTWSRHATTRAWQVRWSFSPSYRFDPVSPAFYLAQVQQIHASGESPPPVQYTYELSADTLASASLQRCNKFDPVIAAYGEAVALPSYSTAVDANADGLPDLEVASDYTLVSQGGTGYEYDPAPPASPSARPECRSPVSPWNTPRTLAAMRASSVEVQVVSLVSAGTSTKLLLCDRAGEALFETTLADDWTLGEKARLVDLNRDHQPDLIQVFDDGYQVIPNLSTAAGYAFGAPITGTLSLGFPFSGVWLQDFNGDELPDIITTTGSLVVVFFNTGRFTFDPIPRTYEVLDFSGKAFDPSSFTFTWVDADSDGLIDLLLSMEDSAYLFRNTGDAFAGVYIHGQMSVSASATLPLFADLNGSGNAEVFFILNGAGYSIELSNPGTGLLRTADDGKGTRLTFTWTRASPAIGLRARHPVLSAVASESLGHGVLTTSYQYGKPTMHSAGKFLVGYDQVTATTPLVSASEWFLNGDWFSGVLAASRTHDRNAPAADRIEQRAYEDAIYQGLPWKRLKVAVRGWESADGASSVTERTDYETFEAEICPRQTRKTSSNGVLVTIETRAQISGLEGSLHCLPAQVDTTGVHADSSLDFSHTALISRNSAGQVTQIQSAAASGTLTVQSVTYDSEFKIQSVSSPGKGTTLFAYDATTRLLSSTTLPDGTVVAATSRDPLHDGILALRTTRGTLATSEFFRHDGQERLLKQWDDLGSSTEAVPVHRYAYRFATSSAPASISSTQIVTAAAQSARDTVDLLTAGGDAIATASRIPEGWAFGHVAFRDRSTAATRSFLRPGLAPGADPAALDYGALFDGASQVGSKVDTAFGHPADARTTFHAGVERRVAKGLAISGDLLALTASENGAYSTMSWTDAGERLLAFDDEAGTRYGYAYDALGRLRVVTLPDGTKHVASYDGHGRVWRVERAGVATVETSFDPTTGLVAAKRFLSPGGTLVRSVAYSRDGIGRITLETHKNESSGATKAFNFYYDGATPSAPTARTTLGLLTATSGLGYTKAFQYRADGLLKKRTVSLSGWRRIETAFDYLEGGIVGGRTVKLYSSAGTLLSTSAHAYGYDAYGRLSSEALNGVRFVTYGYDGNGELALATFAAGDTVTIHRDPLTRRWTGSSQTAATYSASTSLRMSGRGLVDSETFTIGPTSLNRTYDYSEQRFLTSTLDGRDSYGYGFDASGLPTFIARNGVTKFITRSGSTLTAGGITYTFDTLGRTSKRGPVSFSYGPDGQLATATLANGSRTYRHDEAGNRLVKLTGSTSTAAYLEEGYLDATGLSEPIRFAGRPVGIVKNGAFQLFATDPRGTVLSEADGTPRIASPFGDRDVHPAVAPVIDYVAKGYDADLGLVRMGVRDYDPEINRFTTPDPLFLEDPQYCLKSPVECSLYGYARNAPIVFTDPEGDAAYEWAEWIESTRAFKSLVALDQVLQATSATSLGPATDAVRLGTSTAIAGVDTLKLGTGFAKASLSSNPYVKAFAISEDIIRAGTGTLLLAGPAAPFTRSTTTVAPKASVAVNNPVPSTVARVVAGKVRPSTLGAPGATDVFVTAAEDIAGMGPAQIAERLKIPQSRNFTVIEFPTPVEGLASPVNRANPGFVGRGLTAGKAREFVLPNGPIPEGAIVRTVGP